MKSKPTHTHTPQRHKTNMVANYFHPSKKGIAMMSNSTRKVALLNMLQHEPLIKQTKKTSTSIEHTASMAAATVAAEYPKGDKNPAFRSFSYIMAS